MVDWAEEEIARLVAIHGAVPPPWYSFPGEHPYSICWRMGGGEAYIMLWSQWWKGQCFDEDQRIAYFRKWPPPACFLEWMLFQVWDIRPWEVGDDFDYDPYFARLESLSFRSKQYYEKDLEDPRWLQSPVPEDN